MSTSSDGPAPPPGSEREADPAAARLPAEPDYLALRGRMAPEVPTRLLARGYYDTRLSLVFEVLRMPAIIPATFAVLAPKHNWKFQVTAKGRMSEERDRVSMPWLLPAIFGVEPVVLVCLNVLDMVWGSFLHVSPEFVREGRYGLIRRFMQTPAHHRVHHGKNPRYIDRNYNSITLFWDWVFGTLEPLDDAESVEFGITRPVQAGSYWDVHFGEFVALFRDMRSAQSLFEAGSYLIKPPGWAPGDDRQTARAIRARYSDGRINGRTHEAQEARR